MRVPIHIAFAATFLVLVSPSRFRSFQERVTKPMGIPAASDENSVVVIARAFWTSVAVVGAAAIGGSLAGFLLAHYVGHPTQRGINALQIFGASVLLLSTIYVRGPTIETYKRQTLIERVDRWLYCGGYFIGTAAIVVSLAWQQ